MLTKSVFLSLPSVSPAFFCPLILSIVDTWFLSLGFLINGWPEPHPLTPTNRGHTSERGSLLLHTRRRAHAHTHTQTHSARGCGGSINTILCSKGLSEIPAQLHPSFHRMKGQKKGSCLNYSHHVISWLKWPIEHLIAAKRYSSQKEKWCWLSVHTRKTHITGKRLLCL